MLDYRIPLHDEKFIASAADRNCKWKNLSFSFVDSAQGVRLNAAVFAEVKLLWRSIY